MRDRSHGPVIYIDPTTGLPKCTPKDCIDKLDSCCEVKETNYKWVGGPVFHEYYYSICRDCGTRTITTLDKKKTDLSYKNAIQNNGIDPKVQEKLNDNREKA